MPSKTLSKKILKPSEPKAATAKQPAKADKPNPGKRVPYGHRVVELGVLPDIQEAASAIAVGVKDLQNTATYAIRQVMMAHEYSKTEKAHVRREDDELKVPGSFCWSA